MTIRTLLVIALLAPAIASAEMSYSFMQGSVGTGDVELFGSDFDTTALSAGVSVAAHKNIALGASYVLFDVDVGSGASLESRVLMVGIVGHIPANDTVDLLLGASFGNAEVEASAGSVTDSIDDDVTQIVVGVRAKATDKVELEASAVHIETFDTSDEAFGVGARGYLTDKFSIGAGYSWDDESTTMSLNVRADF